MLPSLSCLSVKKREFISQPTIFVVYSYIFFLESTEAFVLAPNYTTDVTSEKEGRTSFCTVSLQRFGPDCMC